MTGPGRNTWCCVADTSAWAEGSGQVDLAASNCIGGENANYGGYGRALVQRAARRAGARCP